MILPQPPHDVTRPSWKRWWAILYLVLLGLAVVWLIAAMMIRPDTQGTQHVKSIALAASGAWLGLLLVIGIAVGVFRRPFWRIAENPVWDLLIGVTLLGLSAVSAVTFLGFACQVATAR